MLEVFAYIGISLALAYTSVWYAKMLDYCLDYGSLLDFIRLRIAKSIHAPTIEAALEQAGNKDFASAVNTVDSAYWTVYELTRKKWFKAIICIKCMTIRINIEMQIIAGIIALFSGVPVVLVFAITFIAIGINYKTLITS